MPCCLVLRDVTLQGPYSPEKRAPVPSPNTWMPLKHTGTLKQSVTSQFLRCLKYFWRLDKVADKIFKSTVCFVRANLLPAKPCWQMEEVFYFVTN